MEFQTPELPDNALQKISQIALKNVSDAARIFHCVFLCNVNKQWRQYLGQMNLDDHIVFPGQNQVYTSLTLSKYERKFLKLTPREKEKFFIYATKLLRGYGSLELAGEGITDQVLAHVSLSNAGNLRKLCICQAQKITDVGIAFILQQNPQLEEIQIKRFRQQQSNEQLQGSFLDQVLQLKNLSRLELEDIDSKCIRWGSGSMQQIVQNFPVQHKLVSLKIWKCGLERHPAVQAQLIQNMPNLKNIQLSGQHSLIRQVVNSCRQIQSITYYLERTEDLEQVLVGEQCLHDLQSLSRLEVVVSKTITVPAYILRFIGYLNLEDLSLISESFALHPNINIRSQISHIDSEGVKSLVDSFCDRYSQSPTAYKPLKLSMIGACALGHEAVSALLRLPLLTELNISGCNKITAMDKMRLVAKVKAGRELLENQAIYQKNSKVDRREIRDFIIPAYRGF